MTTRAIILLIATTLVAYAVLAVLQRGVNEPAVFSSPIAMGSRGKTTIRRPLSATQSRRLQKNFLEVPTVPVPGNVATVRQVNAINQFNREQESK